MFRKCHVFPAPFAVYIKKDKRSYVEPDISVICDKDKPDEKGCQGAREYWIVDPETETVTVYGFEHGGNGRGGCRCFFAIRFLGADSGGDF